LRELFQQVVFYAFQIIMSMATTNIGLLTVNVTYNFIH
jgi:hypothetical protein